MKTATIALAFTALLFVAVQARPQESGSEMMVVEEPVPCNLCNVDCPGDKVFRNSNPCLDYCGTGRCPENCDTETHCGCFCPLGMLDIGNGTCVESNMCCEMVLPSIAKCDIGDEIPMETTTA